MPEFLDHTILVLPKFKYMHDRLLGPSYKHINTLKIHENARLLVAYIGFLCIALDFRGHWIRWNIRRRDNKSLMNFRICFIVIHWIEFATIIQNQVFSVFGWCGSRFSRCGVLWRLYFSRFLFMIIQERIEAVGNASYLHSRVSPSTYAYGYFFHSHNWPSSSFEALLSAKKILI